MEISRVCDEPRHGRTATIRAVRAMDPQRQLFIDVDYRHLSTSLPHRVYAYDESTKPPARLLGWRYVVEHAGTPVAIAELRETTEGRYLVRSFTTAEVARAFVAAVEALEKRPDKHAFELRAVRIPALFTTCVWLHSPGADMFAAIASFGSLAVGRVCTATQLVKEVTTNLAQRKTRTP